MGLNLTRARTLTRHASDCRCFPMEFSLAAIVPSDSRCLRGRSAARESAVSPGRFWGGYHCARACCVNRDHHVDPTSRWSLRLSINLDFSRDLWCVGCLGISRPARIDAEMGTGMYYLRCAARDLFLHSTKLRRAEIQSRSKIARTGAARSATALFERLSAARTELPRRSQATIDWASR